MTRLTATTLFEYANDYARAAEAADKGTVYPTLREAAKHFRTSQESVEETIGDYQDSGYLGLAVGLKNGNGYASYKLRGDCRIEAYEE